MGLIAFEGGNQKNLVSHPRGGYQILYIKTEPKTLGSSNYLLPHSYTETIILA